MYLIFDTETSNLPKAAANLPSTHPEYPRVMQLAAVLLDEKFVERAAFCTLIDVPDNLQVNKGAFEAHGISVEMCKRYGVNIKMALTLFHTMLKASKVQIAHNIKFDADMIDIEQNIEFGGKDTLQFPVKLCTMEVCTPICKLENKWNRSTYKWPKLSEAYEYFFRSKFDKAHDALADVRATARIFVHLASSHIIKFENKVSQV